MKLSPNEIIQGEGVTQTKKNTLAWVGKTEPGSSWRKLSYRTGMGKAWRLWPLNFRHECNAKLGKNKKKRKRKRRRRRKRRGTTQRQQHGQPVLMKSFQDLSQHSVGSLFWMPLWLNILQERRKWVICSQPESPVLPKCGVTVCKALPDRLLNETPSTRPIHITW